MVMDEAVTFLRRADGSPPEHVVTADCHQPVSARAIALDGVRWDFSAFPSSAMLPLLGASCYPAHSIWSRHSPARHCDDVTSCASQHDSMYQHTEQDRDHANISIGSEHLVEAHPRQRHVMCVIARD